MFSISCLDFAKGAFPLQLLLGPCCGWEGAIHLLPAVTDGCRLIQFLWFAAVTAFLELPRNDQHGSLDA